MIIPRTVYAIQHNVTKRIYIGSSGKLKERLLSHMNALRTGKHPVEDMQKDFDEFGGDYSLIILDEIKTYAEKDKEYEWMNIFHSYIQGVGYNYKDHASNKLGRLSNY